MNGNGGVRKSQNGFSLTEMMAVVLILGIVSAGLFTQIDTAQQRAFSEQVKLDNLQEARDFVDQFFRDINQVGYPNVRMVDSTTGPTWVPPLASPIINDNRLAIGLVRIDANELRFEGDMNGDGVIQSVIYQVNGSGACNLCLQRSQVDKIAGNPLTGQSAANWGTETNDVISNPVFSYFKADGTQVTALPVDLNTAGGPAILASIKTIQISLIIRNNSVLDLKTRQPIETTFEGEISLNNCSMAASGAPMSCQ
jgi:prepilin-type N-terminal cleavage/methylation domain-containing protein